jgi:capsular polysaccharide biosynthesis protein
MFSKSITPIYPAGNIERQAPVNLGGGPSDFFRKVDLHFKPVSLFRYSGVNVTPEGHVFKNFFIDRDLLIYPSHKKKYGFLYLASSLVKRKKIRLSPDEDYLLCFDYWSNSIFHWMCDALPRIEAVKELAKDCVLLLPKFFEYSYIHETLKAFRFKSIYLVEDDTYVYCKKLYVPEQIATSGQMRPENILGLRKTLLQYFQPQFSGKINYPNVYISRSKARFRKVLNEAELLPVLKKYGFEVIYFEDLSVAEQVELCYNAVNIVSIHGANLTNIIFMQPGKNVLELRKLGDMDNNYYYELADSVGCNYFHLDCESEDPEPEKNTFSLYTNPEQFETCLQKLIQPV